MQPLGPRAFGEIFNDAARHRAGIAERIDELARRKLQCGADAGRGAHRAEHGGGMKSGFVGERRRNERQPAHRLDADSEAEQRRFAVAAVALAGREHRRHDDGAGMDRAALERIVEILAVDGGAVDERRGGGGQRARMADRGARPVIVAGGERAFHIIFVARGHGEPDHVDQQLFAFAPHRWRQLCRIERGNFLRQRFGNGDLGE